MKTKLKLELNFIGMCFMLFLFYEMVQIHVYNFSGINNLTETIIFIVNRTAIGVFIFLFNFNIVALARKNIFWFMKFNLSDITLFILMGVVYTQYNEVINVYFLHTWGYRGILPLMPVFRIGITPFVQWAVFAPLVLVMYREWFPPQEGII